MWPTGRWRRRSTSACRSVGRCFSRARRGVGKTEIAKVLAETLDRDLIRLQCYEGLDIASAVYEWNYSRQMIEIRLAEAAGDTNREALGDDIFTEEFLIKRPLLQRCSRTCQDRRYC